MNADPLFLWLESSWFSIWVREAQTMLAFPTILILHTVGMGLAAGTNAALALRILGFAPRVPLTAMAKFYPTMWIGFWVNAVSGLALLIGYPTKALTNPLFYVKLSLIGLAMVVMQILRNRVFRDSNRDSDERLSTLIPLVALVTLKSRILAGVSLALWAGAILSGRLLAYTYTRLLATGW